MYAAPVADFVDSGAWHPHPHHHRDGPYAEFSEIRCLHSELLLPLECGLPSRDRGPVSSRGRSRRFFGRFNTRSGCTIADEEYDRGDDRAAMRSFFSHVRDRRRAIPIEPTSVARSLAHSNFYRPFADANHGLIRRVSNVVRPSTCATDGPTRAGVRAGRRRRDQGVAGAVNAARKNASERMVHCLR